MRIFDQTAEWPTKVNFIDENNVVLGYSLEQDCCEHADWFIADEPTFEIIDGTMPDLEDWVFDIKYFREFDLEWGGGIAIFRIIRGDEEKFIHLFNVHNGYYAHGFDFSQGDKTIIEDSI